ncbi:MAG: 4Fe-4S binding protein [Desulfobacterales bacterium]|nr:4Fe-4S binding protein [Desulfobacterales bacterium]
MTFQRWVQTLSLALFIVLLWLAAFPLVAPMPVDLFLRTDPLVLFGTWLSARTLAAGLWVAALLLALTPIMGRFFCGMICPMGTTLDIAEHLTGAVRARRKANLPRGLHRIKYQVLVFILAAAAFGISLIFLASPMAWITRFYGLILYPILCLGADLTLWALRPAADFLNLPALAYAQVPIRRYDLQWITVFFMVLLMAGSRLAPRFWCRFLCPAGAAFALLSPRPAIGRTVSDACTDCGLCAKNCPVGAIGENPLTTNHRECIVCQTCVGVCPVHAIDFRRNSRPALPVTTTPPQRRQFITASLAGAATALVSLTGLNQQHGRPGLGQVTGADLIRPPAAIPEADFLALCIRCGQCMKACPTNTLQPIALTAGLTGFFSPVLTPRRGPCEPKCHACGEVCPTQAIRRIPDQDRIWAKVGTAHVLRHKCLAWEWDRRCLVCDEVCPYDAIELRQVPGISVAVPFVMETRCAGCGFCQHHCPIAPAAAIVVEPTGALRLARGRFEDKGRESGLMLKIHKKGTAVENGPGDGGAPFDSEAGGLPPGFTE